jgi:cytochrome c biogenesis protein CcdA
MHAVLRLIGIVIAIGLADSLNPGTVAPALYLATSESPKDKLVKFTAGVFIVYLAGGALIAAGPGQLLLSLVPHPGPIFLQYVEMGAGVVMIVGAALLWRYRHPLKEKELPEVIAGGRSSFLFGAGLTLVELPTAFPYFGALAAIVASHLGFVREAILVVLFNVMFIVPLLGIVETLYLAGEHAEQRLGRVKDHLQRHWPVILAVVALAAGLFTIGLGATSYIHHASSRFGKYLRHLLHVHYHPVGH